MFIKSVVPTTDVGFIVHMFIILQISRSTPQQGTHRGGALTTQVLQIVIIITSVVVWTEQHITACSPSKKRRKIRLLRLQTP
jgi:hypothetical protein